LGILHYIFTFVHLMNTVYLLTGSNLDNRHEQLSEAMFGIGKRCGEVVDFSSIYETAAWGKTDQRDFLNQAMMIYSPLDPSALLKELLAIEKYMGRERDEKYGPRVIDIDILFFNHQIIREPGLSIPHPRLQDRRFALEPLNEIAPALIHPAFHKPICQLLAECPDPLPVKKI